MKITHIEEDTDKNALIEFKGALIRIEEVKQALIKEIKNSFECYVTLIKHEEELRQMIIDIQQRLK
jgi:hypothetical protein